MKFMFVFFLAHLLTSTAYAQDLINLKYLDTKNIERQFESIITTPKSPGKKGAVILLHHRGGWKVGTTNQYAELFEKNNIISVEPRMFDTTPDNPLVHLSQLFSTLKYLGKREDVDATKISVIGLSWGASLSIYAGTRWAQEQYGKEAPPIKNIIPLYPTCFFHEDLIKRRPVLIERMRGFGFVDGFHETWAKIPITIFTGGLDDYDNRMQEPCKGFIASILDAEQWKVTSEISYPKATHGWDRSEFRDAQTRIEPLGCKMTRCNVTIEYNKEVTNSVKLKILEILEK